MATASRIWRCGARRMGRGIGRRHRAATRQPMGISGGTVASGMCPLCARPTPRIGDRVMEEETIVSMVGRKWGWRTGLTCVLAVLAMFASVGAVQAQTVTVVEYYHVDALGSVRAVTDQTQTLVERHDYAAFGEE